MEENGSKNNLQPGMNPVQQPVQQPTQQPAYPQPQYAQAQYQQPRYQQPAQPTYQQPAYSQQPGYPQPQSAQPQQRYAQQPQYQQPQYRQQPAYPQAQYQQQAQYRQQMYSQPQYQQPQYAPQGYGDAPKKKKKWIIPVAIVAALAVICGAAALILLGTPAALLGRAASNTAKAIGNNEFFTAAEDVYNGGSVDIRADLSKISASLIGAPMTIEGGVKVFTDADDSKSAVEITVNALGTTMDAGIYIEGKEFAVKSDFIFDGKAYGLDLSKAYKELKDSPFGPGGAYELDSEVYDVISEMLKSYSESSKDNEVEKLSADGVEIIKDYVNFLRKTIFKYADIDKSSSKISIGGEKVKVTVVTVDLDSEAMGNIIEAVLVKIADDKQLKDYIESIAAYIDKTYSGSIDADDMLNGIDDIFDEIDDALENIDDIREELDDEDVSLSINYYINGQTELIGFLAEIEDEAYSNKVKVLYGPDVNSPDEISLAIGEKNDGYSISYKVDTNDGEDYRAKFSYTDYWDEIVGNLNYDKKNGDFDLTVNDGYDSVTLYGNLEKTKDSYVFDFEGLRGDDIPNEVGTIVSCIDVTVKTKDPAPQMPEYTDFLKMSDKQIEKLVEDISSEFMGLVMGMW